MAATSGHGRDVSATAHTIVPAPIATNEQHVCFICLQNDADTPKATWVNPCPCSLEAHEDCMLQWVAEMETSSNRSRSGFKCPACKAPIVIDEPYDAFLALRDRLYRRYSRVAPLVLFVVVSGSTIAGSSSYGYGAASIFAGHDAVARWIRPCSGRGIPTVVLKAFALSTIGPGLVITRWLPWLGSLVLVPISTWYAGYLVAHENLPTWPPSPEWAMALMPYVHLGYTFLYYDLFGPLERRLNRALRGRPPPDDAANARAEEARADAAAPAAAANEEQADDGVWNTVLNFSRAALGLFRNWRVEVEIEDEVEFMIGGGGNDQPPGADGRADEDEGNPAEDNDDDEGEEEFQILARVAVGQPAPPPPPPAAADQQPPARQANNQQNQNNQNPRPNNNNNNNNNNINNNNNDAGAGAQAETSYLTMLLNSMATSLLLPAISYGMGELIRLAAPKSWVVARPPCRGGRGSTGLLQERWGRSLVGGCLFVVLRDAVALYTKYRRVQVKTHRKVRNVERKRIIGGGGGAQLGSGPAGAGGQ